ncbi:hypothetical protein QA634_03710 [Methylobacterium sp. CB376]|uniref:hypothetical protein n=1 Tax=unclassified Methylobacterium TaxID=2615210 RepID=UPI0002F05C61|nr:MULTISPECIES: hypothetical protein [Methylobacterium]WFT81021.1 hypothetical protein QA634_03710 [Methylobacterium nodulans]
MVTLVNAAVSLAAAFFLGLFAEGIDAAGGERRGNVPRGFTHWRSSTTPCASPA